jgi:hypothetical protein
VQWPATTIAGARSVSAATVGGITGSKKRIAQVQAAAVDGGLL